MELPGLAGWVYSQPLELAGGGDVHYFSVCSKGSLTHRSCGRSRARKRRQFDRKKLRHVLQRHTDSWDQSALMRDLNEAFGRELVESQYATAAVLGFTSRPENSCLAARATRRFSGTAPPTTPGTCCRTQRLGVDIEGLPLGLISGTAYSQTGVRLGADGMLVLYTDGITEAMDSGGNELGQRVSWSWLATAISRPIKSAGP